MSGGEPSSIKRRSSSAAASLHLYAKRRSRVLCPLFLVFGEVCRCIARCIANGVRSGLPMWWGRPHCHRAAEPDCRRAHRPCLPVYRNPWYRQDHLCQDLCQGGQLPGPYQPRSLLRMRDLQGHRQRRHHGHHRDGRGVQQRRGRYPRPAGRSGVSALGLPVQGIHHRRGAHALHAGVQCPAQDDGRTAGACDLHSGHHRGAESPGDHPQPMPAVRLCPDHGPGHRGTADLSWPAGKNRAGTGCGPADRPSGRRCHARCTLHSGYLRRCGQPRGRSAGAPDGGCDRPQLSV